MTEYERPRYMISVAADLVGMHPQTLRIYEAKGLIRPKRTAGNTRLYSERDVDRLRLIQSLTSELEKPQVPPSKLTQLASSLSDLQKQMATLKGAVK